jgi:hypothetical protein
MPALDAASQPAGSIARSPDGCSPPPLSSLREQPREKRRVLVCKADHRGVVPEQTGRQAVQLMSACEGSNCASH